MKRLLFMIVILMMSHKSFAEQDVVFEHLEKPRVIVLTDITNEPDDEQSMVRFLIYSNEYDVEGLIATTSVWLRDKVRPEKIRERIEAYGKVRKNLLKHSPGYPTTEHLLSVTRAGQPNQPLLRRLERTLRSLPNVRRDAAYLDKCARRPGYGHRGKRYRIHLGPGNNLEMAGGISARFRGPDGLVCG